MTKKKKNLPKSNFDPVLNKNPKSAVKPSRHKDPGSTADPDRYYDVNPTWRVAQIELCDPYGWHILSAEQFSDVKNRLSNFESMTWREILLDGKKANHQISVDKLSKSARDRLSEIGQDDLEEIVSLRLSAKERIWGVLDRGSLNLLWWDPDHQVCPSSKKHT